MMQFRVKEASFINHIECFCLRKRIDPKYHLYRGQGSTNQSSQCVYDGSVSLGHIWTLTVMDEKKG